MASDAKPKRIKNATQQDDKKNGKRIFIGMRCRIEAIIDSIKEDNQQDVD